jgi:Cft2 family RNA processing exonuclease
MDVTQYAALTREMFSDIDLVLLSHYSLAHCGALPYLLFRAQQGSGKKKLLLKNELSTRIVATEAVRRMGELTLASLHEDIEKVKDVVVSDGTYAMSIEDIVSAFSGVEPVQFNEKFDLVVRGIKISITAQPAGRLIGGAYFVITVGSEQIVYAVDYALTGGKAVGGMYPSPAKNASILITDGSKASSELISNTKRPEEMLISSIKHTLRNGGTVLMPVDPNGPVLDLILMLESAFVADASLLVYPVVFLSPLGDVVLDQVKTRMEWMNKHVLTAFEESVNFQAHPFLLNHVELCSDFFEFNEKFGQSRRPKVILATCASLDYGDSRELFAKLGGDPNNLLLLTHIVGLSPASLAHRVLASACTEFKETQFVKSSYPDEQLRQIYRDCLEKEAQDDELRRRRLREKMLGIQQAAAPSSASAVPVDLIRGANHLGAGMDLEGLDTAGGMFFRPQLFAAQTLASGTVVKGHRIASDYGEELNSLEVDTWRAHAEMGDLGAAREAAVLAAQQQHNVKSEKGVKGEWTAGTIKGDISCEENGSGHNMKAEQNSAAFLMGAAESFDWRRDLQMRFGEPQRVEVRERVFKVACKVKHVPGLDYHAAAVHRREFIASSGPKNLIMLPTKNVQDIQLVGLMMKERAKRFFPTQEESGGDKIIIPLPATVSISGEKKWIHLDPALLSVLDFKTVPESGGVKISKLSKTVLVDMSEKQNQDLIKVPCGDFIDFAIVENPDKKRSRTSPADSSLLVNSRPFRLGDFAKELRKNLLENSTVEFVTTELGRALSVTTLGGQVLIVSTSSPGGGAGTGCPLVELLGPPSACFYKVRQILYASNLCL